MRHRTSRTGLSYEELESFVSTRIQHNSKFRLKLLRFFVDTSIPNPGFYWTELICFMHKYCELRRLCPDLDSVDLGGSLPAGNLHNSMHDNQRIVDQIIDTTKICSRNNVPVPRLSTKFGICTGREIEAALHKVIEQKQCDDRKMCYMIDAPPIMQLPDNMGNSFRLITLASNN